MNFDENKPKPSDRSIFRKNIGRALLNRDGDPYLTTWNIGFTSRINRRLHSDRRDIDKEKRIESQITEILRENFSFKYIVHARQIDRMGSKGLESPLISTVANCSVCRPSENWLGNNSPQKKIRQYGVWQVQHVASKRIDDDERNHIEQAIRDTKRFQRSGLDIKTSARREIETSKLSEKMTSHILTNKHEIENAQNEIIKRLKTSCDRPIRVRLGYQGGNKDVIIHWSSTLGLWFNSRKHEKGRYWNAFGLSEVAPKESSMLSIVCEINPPFEGINRRVQGAFAHDEYGHTWLLYRGKLGGGKPGINRTLFFNNYQGEEREIEGDRFAILGDIDAPDFVQRLSDFIREVDQIKSLV